MKKTILFVAVILLMLTKMATSQVATLETLNGSYGSMQVRVDLTGFTEAVGAVTMRIGFDSNVASFTGIGYEAIASGINANVVGDEIVVAWSSTDAVLVSGTAFKLIFSYTGGSCNLTFNEGCEISNGSGSLFATTFTNGAINQPTGAIASIGNQPGVLSIVNELPITFTGFVASPMTERVGAITLNVGYDVNTLAFVGIAGLAGAVANDLSGVIHITWSSETAINLNSTNLRLQFSYLGGTSYVNFVGTNSISKANGDPISVSFGNGQITQPSTISKVILDTVVGQVSGITEVPVMFTGFSESQGSITMHISYNTGVLNFVGTSGLSGVNANAENGIVTLVWSNANGEQISSFKLLFNYLGGTSNLEFTGLNEIANTSGDVLSVVYGDGIVIQPTATVNVSLGNIYLTSGNSIITVPINVNGSASAVHGATMYVNFDQTKLTYIGIENAPSGTVANQDPSTKTIIITWANPSGSIVNANVFLNLKFAFTGGAYNCSVPIYFTTYNSNASMLANGSGENLLANWSDGSVNLKVLNLTLFLEGLYNGGGEMREVLNELYEPQWGTGIADKIIVELHSSSPYTDIIYTSPLTELSTAGKATIVIPTNLIGSYYITIKHRNSIETTTSAPVSFENCVTSYNFNTSVSQAFGDNMKEIGGMSVIYCGDWTSAATPYPSIIAVQDGVVDDSDYSDVYNSFLNEDKGYLPQDINGDGLVNWSDIDLIITNYNIGVCSNLP